MDRPQLLSELQFKMARSSGSGGQHVNKVATKVVLSFNLRDSQGLSDQQKELLSQRLASRLTSSGYLQLHCGETRSQLRNKRLVIQRFFALLEQGLREEKPRKPTKIPKGVLKKRREDKRRQSQKKANRKPPQF
ncbi:alternative ribosome rescue aminoacyl-tRNA hydrolase ArfB [Gilvibacter sediminis]|uniref:alternative ribosome rescue aminoacyl-tRNA hydrolase ArfB n=1 Tax=Gilvibacter sediminis TaxID=379071 RepID=UPI00234FEADF|nr:alternative ribosome rescue aminoacyl-tRNA hydrolase ArfB [Gilvibacter sediminis]MDC7997179.1 alternative ribosome rescue aminoacyl-tRNA hydrolase ArfB [Gilvibacter sediminis]